jgi:hypothetical protein
MWKPRIILGIATMGVAFTLLGAPVRAAAPPKITDETDLSPHFLRSAASEAVMVWMTTQLLSPRAVIKKTPPPVNPPPLVVRPPEPVQPDPVTPSEPPPILTEVPEPGTLVTALVGGSIALWSFVRRRRQQPDEESKAQV